MIYYAYVNPLTGEAVKGGICSTWAEYHNITFAPLPVTDYPGIEHNIFVTDFKAKGVDYHEAKEDARRIVIDLLDNAAPDLSYGEICDIAAELERIGKRYGLLKEFRENGLI